jgi:hypothetical protein
MLQTFTNNMTLGWSLHSYSHVCIVMQIWVSSFDERCNIKCQWHKSLILKCSDDVYYTLDYLVARLLPSSLAKIEHDVLGTGNNPVFEWKDGVEPTKVGPTERAILTHWTPHIILPLRMCLGSGCGDGRQYKIWSKNYENTNRDLKLRQWDINAKFFFWYFPHHVSLLMSYNVPTMTTTNFNVFYSPWNHIARRISVSSLYTIFRST